MKSATWHRFKLHSILNAKCFGVNDPNGPEKDITTLRFSRDDLKIPF